jgi:hypothetical protein
MHRRRVHRLAPYQIRQHSRSRRGPPRHPTPPVVRVALAAPVIAASSAPPVELASTTTYRSPPSGHGNEAITLAAHHPPIEAWTRWPEPSWHSQRRVNTSTTMPSPPDLKTRGPRRPTTTRATCGDRSSQTLLQHSQPHTPSMSPQTAVERKRECRHSWTFFRCGLDFQATHLRSKKCLAQGPQKLHRVAHEPGLVPLEQYIQAIFEELAGDIKEVGATAGVTS